MSGVDPMVPPPPPPGMPSLEQKPGNGLAVASLVLGIVSLGLFCVWYVALPCAVLAIIFGKVAGNRARAGASGAGMAKAGLICGIIALALAIVIVGSIVVGASGCAIAGLSILDAQNAGQLP